MLTRKPTIRDVAKKAGVSIATVSFVLNKRPGQVISEVVTQRVLKTAEQLNYHPNASAAGLARKRTHNVAVVFYREPHMISNQFYSFVIQGAVSAAMEAEYNLFFAFVPEPYKGPSDLPKVIREAATEGVLLLQEVHPQMIADIKATELPLVTIDPFPRIAEVDSLEIDNRSGGTIAAQHLLELGHHRLVFLGAARQRPSIADRAAGFVEEIERQLRSRAPKTLTVDCADLTFGAGYAKARELLAKNRRPTAFFCANDELAAGVLRAAHELGIKVPEELSVVGFDDITMSQYSNPPLTTIGLSKPTLGAYAMRRLLDRIEGASHGVLHEVVPVTLVLRGSTAPPRVDG